MLRDRVAESEDVVIAGVDHDQIEFPGPVVELAGRDDEHLEAHLGQQAHHLDPERELVKAVNLSLSDRQGGGGLTRFRSRSILEDESSCSRRESLPGLLALPQFLY